MREEAPKKEILTKERIQADLLVPAHLFPWILLFPVAIALPVIMGVILWDPSILPLSLCSIGLGYTFIRLLIRQSRVKAGKFTIVQDTLVDKIQNARISATDHRARSMRDLLIFSVYGKCFLLYKLYYKWSRLYSMRPREVFDDSYIGDTFYLVIFDGDRKKKPVMVYNTKMFELKEE